MMITAGYNYDLAIKNTLRHLEFLNYINNLDEDDKKII